MKFVFYTNSVSPHQLPLARELIKRIGEDEYRYVYTTPLTSERLNLGWNVAETKWIVCEKDCPAECREWLETCEVLMSGVRDFSLFEARSATGRKTIYSAERWFKPIRVACWSFGVDLPGWLKLIHPRYFKYAWRLASLIKDENLFFCYPMGVWARHDIEIVCRLFLVPRGKLDRKMRLWGYFVEPTQAEKLRCASPNPKKPRLLWVGRLLKLKRVKDIILAVNALCKNGQRLTLDVYGQGPEERHLKRIMAKLGLKEIVNFRRPVPIAEVRRLMREHDVYVFSSNAQDGWGAVVSEALEEGMRVIGTYEAGASATLLPSTNLYHAGDWKTLARILSGNIPFVNIGQWNVKAAADFLVQEMGLA